MSSVQERIQSLEVALNNELKEKEFYLKQADRTTNPVGKSMFKSIAKEEAEHYERLQELHKSLKEKGKWTETIPLSVKGTEVKTVLQKVIDSVDSSSKTDVDDIKALEIAIEFEKNGEQFYKKLFESVTDASEKEFYKLLMSIEREHRLSLEDTYAYFKDPQEWFHMKEKGRLDGA